MAVAHYLEALDWQREVIKIHAILGGKNPHLQSFLVGGMATPVDPDKQASLNADTLAAVRALIAKAHDFVARVYIPDVLAVASFYKDWAGYGAGVGNYLVYGEYPEDDGPKPPLFLPSGVIRDRDLAQGRARSTRRRSPSRSAHSWYEYAGGDDKGAAPVPGRDEAEVHRAASRRTTGSTPTRSTAGSSRRATTASRWRSARSRGCSSPTRPGHAAREGAGRRRAAASSASAPRRCSRRSAASRRARIETLVLAEKQGDWLDAARRRTWRGTTCASHDNSKWDPSTWPADARAPASTRRRAARSATGSTSRTARSRTTSASCPSTWNAGPRDAAGQRGPYEEALRRHAGRRPDQAARDPPHHPLVRPVPGLRRPRPRRAQAGSRASEGAMIRRQRPRRNASGSTSGSGRSASCHWLIAGSIAVLSVTGLYIANPSPITTGLASAAVADGAGQARSTTRRRSCSASPSSAASGGCSSATTTRSWDKFVPARTKRWKALGPTLGYYLFRLRKPPGFVGHNPLAGLTYTVVFVIYLIMIGDRARDVLRRARTSGRRCGGSRSWCRCSAACRPRAGSTTGSCGC